MKRVAHTRVVVGVLAWLLWGGTPLWAVEEAQQETPMPQTIQDGLTVELDCTLTVDGSTVDSSQGREPLSYVHGQGQIIPGLERQLTGLKIGETKQVTVAPEEGYGPLDPDAFVEVSRQQLPPDLSPQVGQVLRGTSSDGRPFRATIHELGDQTVTLDLNHPLAGKTLLFEVKVVDVHPAAPSSGGP